MQPKIYESFRRIPRGQSRHSGRKSLEKGDSDPSSRTQHQVEGESGESRRPEQHEWKQHRSSKGQHLQEESENGSTGKPESSTARTSRGKRYDSEPHLRASAERDSSDRHRASSSEKRRARDDLHRSVPPKKSYRRRPSEEESTGRPSPAKHRSSFTGKRPTRDELRPKGRPKEEHSKKRPSEMEDSRKDGSDTHRIVAERRRSYFENRPNRQVPGRAAAQADRKQHASRQASEKQVTEKSSPDPDASPFATNRREELRNRLRDAAAETISILPTIVSQLPASIDPEAASIHHFKDLAPLRPEDCPGFELPAGESVTKRKGTRIRVLDQDSFDAALDLQPGITARSLLPAPLSTTSNDDDQTKSAHPSTSPTNTPTPPPPIPKPVALLNLANAYHPGGGWLNGALAQEEALCYRSTLSLSLHKNLYPIPLLSALYTPHVLVIRSALSAGHSLLLPTPPGTPITQPQVLDLPLTSIITLAALRNPYLSPEGTFRPADAEITRYKIRTVLRLAASKGHTKLVLGALGCGAFNNPPDEVAHMFAEVLREEEFAGGWWEDVVFAVMDNARKGEGGRQGDGNFGIFWRALDGLVV